jgi:ferredoxin
VIDKIRQKAAELIGRSAARVVVGYREGRRAGLPVPHFVRRAEDAAALVLTPDCRGGLAVFAVREAAKGPAAFVASPEDVRALKVLVQEKQVPEGNILVIAYAFDGKGNVEAAEGERLSDFKGQKPRDTGEPTADELAKLRAMTPEERWSYWRTEFDKCVRCYACRAACPMCYCTECIADRNLPQWVEVAPRPRGNFAWNLIRGWHLAGRCVECGACERACPQGIKLTTLNRMLADEIAADFGYAAGTGTPEDAAFFATFKDTDDEGFILEK